MNDLVKTPWDKKKWRSGIIQPGFPYIHMFLLAFSAVWLGIAVTLSAQGKVNFQQWSKDATAFVITGGVGLLTFIPGLIGLLRWAKWRGIELRLEKVPVVIGGRLNAVIMLPSLIGDRQLVAATIVNEKLTVSGSGKHQHVDIECIYDEERVAETSMLAMEQDRFMVPVAFTIPYDTHDATENAGRVTYRWRMEVKARTPGLDVGVDMELPVFRTIQSDASVARPQLPSEEVVKYVDQIGPGRDVRLVVEADGEHYVTGGWPKLLKMPVLLAISAVLVGAGIAGILLKLGMLDGAVSEDAMRFGKGVPWWVAVGVLVAGVLIGWLGVHLGARRETWVTGGYLRHKKGMRGVLASFACKDIVKCEAVPNGTSGAKAMYEVRVYYRPGGVDVARGAAGCSQLTVALWMADRIEAEWLWRRLQERISGRK